jgi:hypothetical protein
VNTYAFKPKLKTQSPKRTFAEMAEEFGVTGGALAAFMKHHPGAPKPCLIHRNMHQSHRTTWYDPAEFKRWWATVPKA